MRYNEDAQEVVRGLPRKQYIPTLAQVAYHGRFQESDVIEDIRHFSRHHNHDESYPCIYVGYSEIVIYAHIWRCSAEGCGYCVIRLCNRFVDRGAKCTCILPLEMAVPNPKGE